MAEVASAYVTLMPSAKGFGSKLDSQISGDISSSGKRAGSKFGGAMKAGVVGVIAGVGVAAAKFLGGALEEAREAQVVGDRTRNVIKSMGGAANVSAKQVEKLAGAISKKTGIDDEAIQSGQNLLLTFGNVRNETGKGNKIFDQASQLMVDMSAAMGTDAKGSAIQLGKALNDPVKGITALSRVGVSFTEGQKEQIKALVETGDTMGAQKVILGELTRQFGGAAETMATPADKAKVAFGNLQESLGSKLLPVVDKVLTLFTNKGIPALSSFGDTVSKAAGPLIAVFGDYIRSTVIPMVQRLADWVSGSLVPALSDFGRDVLPAVKDALGSVKDGLKAAQPFFELVGNIVTKVLIPVLGKLAKTILPLVADQLVIVAKGFGKLGDAGTWLWNKALQPAFKFIVKGIASILDMWSSMLSTLAKVPGFGWAKKAADAMANAADKARDIADGIKKIPPSKTVSITVAYKYTGLKSTTRGRDDEFDPLGRGRVPDPGKGAFSSVLASYGQTGKNLMDRITKGIKAATPKTVQAAQDAFDSLKSKMETKRDEIQATVDGLKDIFDGIRSTVAEAFAGNLFDVGATEAKDAVFEMIGGKSVETEAAVAARSVGQNFIDNLMGKKAELTGLLASFNVLKGWGVDPAFLTQLFSSGNGALITELAGMGQEGALSTASLFGEVTNLGAQLGTSVATNDPVAAEMVTANATLVEIRDALAYLGGDIGKELNQAASKAQRDKKKRGKK